MGPALSLPHRQEMKLSGAATYPGCYLLSGWREGNWALLVLLRSFSLIKCQVANKLNDFFILGGETWDIECVLLSTFLYLNFSRNTEQEGWSL